MLTRIQRSVNVKRNVDISDGSSTTPPADQSAGVLLWIGPTRDAAELVAVTDVQ